jgi:hypothetical protein
MPIAAVFCGVILIVIGAAGYFYGRSIGAASPTALIPAAFGLLFVLFGVLASVKDSWRKHMMHAAAGVALIGFILTAGRLLMRVGQVSMSPAVISQLATAVVCLIFLLAAIGSFAAARKNPEP